MRFSKNKFRPNLTGDAKKRGDRTSSGTASATAATGGPTALPNRVRKTSQSQNQQKTEAPAAEEREKFNSQTPENQETLIAKNSSSPEISPDVPQRFAAGENINDSSANSDDLTQSQQLSMKRPPTIQKTNFNDSQIINEEGEISDLKIASPVSSPRSKQIIQPPAVSTAITPLTPLNNQSNNNSSNNTSSSSPEQNQSVHQIHQQNNVIQQRVRRPTCESQYSNSGNPLNNSVVITNPASVFHKRKADHKKKFNTGVPERSQMTMFDLIYYNPMDGSRMSTSSSRRTSRASSTMSDAGSVNKDQETILPAGIPEEVSAKLATAEAEKKELEAKKALLEAEATAEPEDEVDEAMPVPQVNEKIQ